MNANALERLLIHYILFWSMCAAFKRGRKAGRFPDAQPCYLDVPALAKAWSVSRTHLSEARADLIADRIIIPLDDGFTINRDVDSWEAGRISRASIEFARGMADARPVGKWGPSRYPLVRRGGQGRTSLVPREGQSCPPGGTNSSISVPRRGQSCPPGGTRRPSAYRNAPASEDSQKIEEEKQADGAPPAIRGTVADSKPSPSPTRTIPKVSGPGSDSPEAERLAEWARGIGGDLLAHIARQYCDEAPVEWTEALIRRRVIGNPPREGPRLTNYLGSIMASWLKAGECEYLRPTSAGTRQASVRGIQRLTPEVVASRSAKIAEIVAKMPPRKEAHRA